MALSELAKEIYQRQLLLPELGEAGQERLSASRVLVCGCGGLGSPVCMYLAALGVGTLGLLDGDTVSCSNLNRQLLYSRRDVGRPKVEAAAERIQAQNPDVQLELYPEYLTEGNARDLLSGYDLAMDCLDNFPSRFILNDACLDLKIPFIHGGVPEAPAPEEKAIIGATAGVIASLQVTEAFKCLIGQPVNRGLLVYDGWQPGTRLLALQPDPDCVCARLR